MKRLDKVHERVGRLKARHGRVARHYDVEVVADESRTRAVAVNWTRRPAEGSMATHPGVYCLRTNVAGWDDAALWRTYTTLTDLEAVFRSMKSELGLRPIHHRKPVRAEGHLFITVVAYQAVQVIRRRRARQLDHAARHPRRPAARHRHLPPRRRPHAARAHRHRRRTRPEGHLRRARHRSEPRRHAPHRSLRPHRHRRRAHP